MDEEKRLLQRRADRERQARKQAEQFIEAKSRELFFSQLALRREKDFVTRLVDTAQVLILVLDASSRILRANHTAASIVGATTTELEGQNAVPAFFGEDPTNEVGELLSGGDRAGGTSTLPLRSRSGEHHEIEWYRAVLDDPEGGPPLLLLVGHDVTERVRLFREVERLSVTDPLTGLHNRRHFNAAANDEVLRATRYQRPLSAVMVDIDHFKRVNDTYGHAVGDRVLVAVAAACVSGTRTVDIRARLGGEEFCILLPETAAAGAVAVAERLRIALAALRFASSDGQDFHVTASFGIAERSSGEEFEALVRRADEALYEAKSTGRNRVVIHGGGT